MFGPEALVTGEPVHRFLHGCGRELAGDGAADLRALDEARIRKHLEMLHDGRQRHRIGVRELAHGNILPRAELCKQRPPRRIGKRGKGAVERRLLMLNHTVKY